jgi:hypothetical protein
VPADAPAERVSIPGWARQILPVIVFIVLGLCSAVKSKAKWIVGAAIVGLFLAGAVITKSLGA